MPVFIVAIVFLFVSFSVYIKYRTEQLKSGSGLLQDENVALKSKSGARGTYPGTRIHRH